MRCRKCGNRIVDGKTECSFCTLDANIKEPEGLKEYKEKVRKKLKKERFWFEFVAFLGLLPYVFSSFSRLETHYLINIANSRILLTLEQIGLIVIAIDFVLYAIYLIRIRNKMIKEIGRMSK